MPQGILLSARESNNPHDKQHDNGDQNHADNAYAACSIAVAVGYAADDAKASEQKKKQEDEEDDSDG
jgi:hypothetical protein